MRKRLKNPAPLEITERRQVGDAEATVHPAAARAASHEQRHFYPARGSDSEL
jgi:hypothetical protein